MAPLAEAAEALAGRFDLDRVHRNHFDTESWALFATDRGPVREDAIAEGQGAGGTYQLAEKSSQ
jgi:hypothetical protein